MFLPNKSTHEEPLLRFEDANFKELIRLFVYKVPLFLAY